MFNSTRWYDVHDISPLYPFGHGLSYTTIAYSDLQLSATQLTKDNFTFDGAESRSRAVLTGSVRVRNTGAYPDAEVVQVYLSSGMPCDLIDDARRREYLHTKAIHDGIPIKQLKAFNRSAVIGINTAADTGAVYFQLSSRDFSSWDERTRQWVLACPGSSSSISTRSTNTDTDSTSTSSSSGTSSGIGSGAGSSVTTIIHSGYSGSCCFQLSVGSSSRDIRLHTTVKIQ